MGLGRVGMGLVCVWGRVWGEYGVGLDWGLGWVTSSPSA